MSNKVSLILGDYTKSFEEQLMWNIHEIAYKNNIPMEELGNYIVKLENVSDSNANIAYDVVIQEYDIKDDNWLKAIRLINEFINSSSEFVSQVDAQIKKFISADMLKGIVGDRVRIGVPYVLPLTINETFSLDPSHRNISFKLILRVIINVHK